MRRSFWSKIDYLKAKGPFWPVTSLPMEIWNFKNGCDFFRYDFRSGRKLIYLNWKWRSPGWFHRWSKTEIVKPETPSVRYFRFKSTTKTSGEKKQCEGGLKCSCKKINSQTVRHGPNDFDFASQNSRHHPRPSSTPRRYAQGCCSAADQALMKGIAHTIASRAWTMIQQLRETAGTTHR